MYHIVVRNCELDQTVILTPAALSFTFQFWKTKISHQNYRPT